MPTKRITYIDALRGFTMILVIVNHVSAYCFGVPYTLNDLENGCYSFTAFFREFRMPLFFFISGFVLYKATVVWNWKHIVAFFKKKIPVQLLSPFLFFAAYMFLFGKDFKESIYHPYKIGYWFTYTLLEFYILYAVVRYVLYKLKARSFLTDVCLTGWGFLVMLLAWYVLKKQPLYNLLGTETWQYFIYFVLGTLTRKHFPHFEQMLDKGPIVVLAVLSFLGFNIFYRQLPPHFLYHIPTLHVVDFLLAVSGIIIVFSFFRKHLNTNQTDKETVSLTEESISDIQKFRAAPLQFIGRRTLDIYLLHYFFIPRQLAEAFPFFHDHAMPVLEMAGSLIISAVVIAACLIVGSVLRLNPNMAHHLFGASLPTSTKGSPSFLADKETGSKQ